MKKLYIDKLQRCYHINIHSLFSDDAEKMFEEAKVVSPNRKITISTAMTNAPSTGKNWIGRKSSVSGSSSSASHSADVFDCEICFLSLPKSVSINLTLVKPYSS